MAHLAATLPEFICCEHHAADMPWWQDLVVGVRKPILNDGYVEVPDTPGLGVELNEEVVRRHLREPGYFEPTPMFDRMITSGYVPNRGGWPHFDDDGNWCENCTTS
jgi:hypothetical protein